MNPILYEIKYALKREKNIHHSGSTAFWDNCKFSKFFD
jgi:hypothetical protein